MALDIVSYGRRGPSAPKVFSPEQVAQLDRTARGAPEVMVKVSGGGKDAGGVQAHFEYIDRHGTLEIETDDGQRLLGDEASTELMRDWNLDVTATRRSHRAADDTKRIPKLVHNIVLSMPAQSPPEKVLKAAQLFARENFAMKHRYAMVLHTDTAHPHVHLVVKAKSEEGQRLYIRKATLREWREDFARALREQGLEANATPWAIRGKTKEQKLQGIVRAAKRGASTHVKTRVKAVAVELRSGSIKAEAGKASVTRTRKAVLEDWEKARALLSAQGEDRVAARVRSFLSRMSPPLTEKEKLAAVLLRKVDRHRASNIQQKDIEQDY